MMPLLTGYVLGYVSICETINNANIYQSGENAGVLNDEKSRSYYQTVQA
jgi:hypothetical protein